MIKFLDLHKLNKPFETQFLAKTKSFLDNGWYVLGEEVKQFDQSFATFSNSKVFISSTHPRLNPVIAGLALGL